MSEIISVVNQKGGTGKTTTTMNLGTALSELGRKVLLVDLDPQANLTYSLGINDEKGNIADAITGNKTAKQLIVKADGLDIIPGSRDMADVEVSLVNQADREKFLASALKPFSKTYDYILIDSPPSLSLITINALTASNSVLIPMQLEVLSLQGLDQIMNTISEVKSTFNPGLKIKGILLVMYDKRRKLSQELQEFLSENVESKIYKTLIRLNVKIAEAPSFGQSVIHYDRTSNGAMDYLAFAKEFEMAEEAARHEKRLKNTH